MPDTQILRALSLQDKMLEKIDGKIDGVRKDFNDHLVEDSKNFQRLADVCDTNARRFEAHKMDHAKAEEEENKVLDRRGERKFSLVQLGLGGAIAAGFGWLGKHFNLWAFLTILLPLGCLTAGCGLTAQERQQIIDESSKVGSAAASEIATKIAYDQAIKQGKSVDEATKLATEAGDLARAAAGAAAGAAAAKAAEATAAEKESKGGSTFTAILMAALGLAGSLLKTVAK